MADQKQVLCFGGGHIAQAMLHPYLHAPEYRLTVIDPDASVREAWQKQGVASLAEPSYDDQPDYVLIAVRPVHVMDLKAHLAAYQENAVVISVVAGLPIDLLCRLLSLSSCIRVMPNLAVSLGQGVIGVYASPLFSQTCRDEIQRFFTPMGLLVWVAEESALEAITAVAGSGPAYLFAVLDHWYHAACSLGLRPEEARQMVLKTVEGALALVLAHPDRHFDAWCDSVASRGGVTEKALAVFREADMRGTWLHALQAAHHHTAVMGSALYRMLDES